MNHTLVAIPMKDPLLAKSRLAAVLDAAQRERLVLSLFERTLDFFRVAFPQFDVAVVTASDATALRAHAARAAVIREGDAHGLNAAVLRGVTWAVERHYERMIIVPADIPVLLREEVEHMLALGASCDVAISEAHDGGTNMLVLSPPCDIGFRYGPDSARRHDASACARGLRVKRCMLPFMARDLDTPADCLVLSQKISQRETLRLSDRVLP